VSLLQKLRERTPRHFQYKLLMAGVSLAIGLLILETAEWWLDVADPPVFARHPAYSFLMKPDQSVATRGHRFRINHFGLRGAEIVMPKPAGVYRIAFLGDSVTYGGGSVRDEELFVNRVAASLDPLMEPRIEVVNISAPGWGIKNMAGFVNNVGLFDADLLVWVISSADLRRPLTFMEDHRFLEEKPASRLFYSLRVSWTKLQNLYRQARQPAGTVPGRAEELEANIRTLRTVLAQLMGQGMPVGVVLVPGVRGYDSRSDVARFRDAAEDCATPFLNTAAAFPASQIRAAYIDDVHLSGQGHAIVAGALGPFIGENFLFGRHRRAPRPVPASCLAPENRPLPAAEP
jgi:lysophospholipase L1-like esterase